ncbi:MAG: hypothetical protein ABIJ34_04110 [archaeon]
MDDNEDKVYKHTSSNIREEIRKDVEENMEKFKDPVVLGEMMFKILEERENTNRILKNIMAKLEKLEQAGVPEAEEIRAELEERLLPEVDEQILALVKQSNGVTAKDVKLRLNYKGTNAASSRLNRLVDAGILKKKQVGKKVFFFPDE